MKLKMWQVDAFASRPLEGNPAAVVPLQNWLDDGLMQRIANENNLAETAFFVPRSSGCYDLRWFTPTSEVDLCGHATLASAWVLFNILTKELNEISFMTRSGELKVTRGANGRNIMSLPAHPPKPYDGPGDAAARIGRALGAPPPDELFQANYLIALWNDPAIVRGLRGPGEVEPVLKALDSWGLIATAPGDQGYDCVSRFFAPAKAVPEDPVTGSAHCALTPLWSARLGKKELKARQASPRGGDLLCIDDGARTIIQGDCALFLTGEIEI